MLFVSKFRSGEDWTPVRVQDEERGVAGNPTLAAIPKFADAQAGEVDESVAARVKEAIEGMNAEAVLDVLLCYLWRVHNLDYFGRLVSVQLQGRRQVPLF